MKFAGRPKILICLLAVNYFFATSADEGTYEDYQLFKDFIDKIDVTAPPGDHIFRRTAEDGHLSEIEHDSVVYTSTIDDDARSSFDDSTYSGGIATTLFFTMLGKDDDDNNSKLLGSTRAEDTTVLYFTHPVREKRNATSVATEPDEESLTATSMVDDDARSSSDYSTDSGGIATTLGSTKLGEDDDDNDTNSKMPDGTRTRAEDTTVSYFTHPVQEDTATVEEKRDETSASTESDKETIAPTSDPGLETSSVETTRIEITSEKLSDPCEPNPCKNGGTCKERGNGRIECKCLKGISGRRCERVDWCRVLRDDGTTGKSYCDKGEARCVSHERKGNFSCLCYNRKEEFNYDIGECEAKDMCTPNPCKNGGICTTSGYKAQCDCPEGAYGRTCERVNWCFIKTENGRSGADICDQGEARCVENRNNKNFTCVCYNKKEVFDEDLMECIEKPKEKKQYTSEALVKCESGTEGYDDCIDRNAVCYSYSNAYLPYICRCKDGTILNGEACEDTAR